MFYFQMGQSKINGSLTLNKPVERKTMPPFPLIRLTCVDVSQSGHARLRSRPNEPARPERLNS